VIRALWYKKKVRYILLAIVLLAAVLALVPVATRYYLTRWLLDHGADQASIEDIDINLFTGRVALKGAHIERDGKVVLTDSAVYLDIGLRQLFNRKLLIEQSSFSNLLLDIEQYADGSFRIGSYRLGGSTGTKEEIKPVEPADQASLPWLFMAEEVALEKIKILFRRPGFKLEADVDSAKLERFSTDPGDKSGTFVLRGMVNGAPVSLDLKRLGADRDVSVEGEVSVEGFDLGVLAGLVRPALERIAGMTSLAGHLDLKIAGGDAITAGFDGSLGLKQADIGGSGWSTGGALDWQGKLGYRTTAENGGEVSIDGLLTTSAASFRLQEPMVSVDSGKIAINGKTEVGFGSIVKVSSTADLTVSNVAVGLTDVSINQQTGTWKGLVVYENDAGQVKNVVSVDGALQLTDAHLGLPGSSSLRQGGVKVDGKVVVDVSKDVVVTFNGHAGFEKTDYSSEGLDVQSGSTDWQGGLSYTASADGGQVSLDGGLSLADGGLKLAPENISVRLATAELPAQATFGLGLPISYSGESGLTVGGLTAERAGESLLAFDALAVKGVHQGDQEGFVAQGVELTRFAMPPSSLQPFEIGAAAVQVADIAASADLQHISVGSLKIVEPQAADPQTDTLVAKLAQVTAAAASIDGLETVKVASAQADNGVFLATRQGGDQAPLVSLDDLGLDRISWSSSQGTAIDSIHLGGLKGAFKSEPQASSASGQQPAPAEAKSAESKPTGPQAEPSGEATAKSIPVKIGRISIDGASELTYQDLTLPRPMKVKVAVQAAEIAGIDLNRPEEPFSYDIKATVDDYAPLTLKGSATPLAVPFGLELHTVLHNYPLPNLSPLMINAIGMEFKTGRLQLDSTVTIAADQLKSKNTLVLNELEVRGADDDLLKEFNRRLPVPLDTAIFLLTDANRGITLDVPIAGKLNDLKVGIGDVIVTALSKSISVTVTPYLAYTVLGPTGAFAYLGVQIGKTLLSTDLPSIDFNQQSANLEADQMEKLDRIGKRLQKDFESDQQSTVSLCAKVIPNEVANLDGRSIADEAVRQELYRLGDERSAAVRTYLTTIFGLDESRLLACSPSVAFEQNAKPVVEFKR